MYIVDDPTQIHAWDKQAMYEHALSSLELMERAAAAFVHHFENAYPLEANTCVHVLCGPGNNGGDGAAIARLLQAKGYACKVFGFCESLKKRSPDLLQNWERLEQVNAGSVYLNEPYQPNSTVDVLIDALFGVSLDRPLSGAFAKTVDVVNNNEHIQNIVSVDVPSGQKIDGSEPDWPCISANETITFVALKQAALFEETANAWGAIHLESLGFPTPAWATEATQQVLQIADDTYTPVVQPRRRFTHKGTYGHVLVMAGSIGHAGAALLSGIAAYRSGCGLVTFYAPSSLQEILQVSLPEAMCLVDPQPEHLSTFPDLSPYDALVVGPGIGTHVDTERMLGQLFQEVGDLPIVLDADALNLIAKNQALFRALPARSILTPHPGEFARLAGPFNTDYERNELLRAYAKTLPQVDSVIVLKDQYTIVVDQLGKARVNFFDGNPGMASGGMGDALTGVIGSLAAQGLSPFAAAGLGVLLHAKAGDLAAAVYGEAGMLAKDVAERTGLVLQQTIDQLSHIY